MQKLIKRFKQFTQAYVRVVQKILVFVLLLLLYVVGFGLTKLVLMIFQSTWVRKKKPVSKQSYWQHLPAKLDKNNLTSQV